MFDAASRAFECALDASRIKISTSVGRKYAGSTPHQNLTGALIDSRLGDAEDAPMLRGTTVWQRLSDYRSRDRVRVVTLWETGGSSVSLQAGKKGDPSLQWTSRLMNRGGATRGLLDQLFATSLGGVARGLHLTPHAAGTDAFGRPSKPVETAFGNAGTGAK